MVVYEFFDTHPIFRHEEFVAFHATERKRSELTSHALLAHHLAAGHLLRIKRGLYATVPRGMKPEAVIVDPYQIATKLTEDGVVGYHAALQFFGKSQSLSQRYAVLTTHRMKTVHFQGAEFVPVLVPKMLRSLPEWGGGIVEQRHAGGIVRVTTLERTLVDVLDQPAQGGDWEEIWRSLEAVEFFDLAAVITYAVNLKSMLTTAKVGFFLEQHRESLMVEARHLTALRTHRPHQPLYFDRRISEPGRLVAGWNLIVPERILTRSWAEIP
jgi:predicted transcriptional regulator of viral defense system